MELLSLRSTKDDLARGWAARTTVTTPLLARLALELSPANGVSRRRVRSESGEEKASRVIGRERGIQRAIGHRLKACCFSSLFLLALVMLIVMRCLSFEG